MTQPITTKLLEAAASTFEQLGFLFADFELDPVQQEAQVSVVARVNFVGPFEGALELHLAGDLLRGLAANMLGEEGLTTERIMYDALGEVANVVCGNVLPTLAGPQAVFDLAAPVVAASRAGWPAAGVPAAQGSLGLEEGRVDLILYASESEGAGAP